MLHAPERPAWICTACSQPWPCGASRDELLAEYRRDRTALGLLMGSFFVEATEDRPGWADEGVYERFLLWIRAR